MQWDVYANGILVGYVHLRYGKASVFGYTLNEGVDPEYRKLFSGAVEVGDLLDDFVAADAFLDFAVKLIEKSLPLQ